MQPTLTDHLKALASNGLTLAVIAIGGYLTPDLITALIH